MEESLLRRFSYSLHFKNFSRSERENIWIELTKEHPLKRFLPKKEIQRLAAKYQVNAAGIASALGTVQSILPPRRITGKTTRELLEELLARHQEATGREPNGKLDALTDKYDISALNLDVNVSALMRSVISFANSYQDTGSADEFNLNFLFWGRPGTGKTEFAKYMAAETGMELIIKRASDLLSMWVGGTEKNIKDAFDEARRDKAILFLDEADTFFINRESAHRSWEVSQTNELLTQMENHNGILICCTNLIANLDKAAMRRFQWKVEFKPLTREGKLSIYQKYFGPLKNGFGPAETERLIAILNLTPGDLKAVWQRFRFIPEKDRSHSEIISALEKEVEYRGESGHFKIGFGC